MERIQLEVTGYAAATANAGDDGDLVEVLLRLLQRGCERADRRPDAAGGALDMRHAVHAQQPCHRMGMFRCQRVRHFAAASFIVW